MPRRGFIPKREVLADPIYGSTVVTKLINQVMYDGKRGTAQKVCYEAFAAVAEKTGKEATEVFEAAMNNIMPVLEVKARRVGGATYQVPIEIRPERRQTLALRWLVEFSRKRGEKTQAERLCNEIIDASNNTGAAVKRKEDMHKMAEANKAFAHHAAVGGDEPEAADDELARQNDDAAHAGHSAVAHQQHKGRHHQEFIRDGIHELAEIRHLVAAAGKITVHPIRHRGQYEHRRRNCPAPQIAPEMVTDDEHRDQADARDGDFACNGQFHTGTPVTS